METIQVYNLNSLCLACLSRTENMTNLFDSGGDKSHVFNMFVVVANFEIEKSDTLPNYLCSTCAEKLNISYEFRNQCQKTQELLQQYLSNDFNSQFETLDSRGNVTQEIIFDEPNLEESVEESPVKNVAQPHGEKRSKVRTKKKQKMRLKQFPYDEVLRAIEQRKRKFFENRNCIKCSFQASNSRALSIHVSHIHKELKDRWCSFCNWEFDSIAEHVKSHNNEDQKCQFCAKIFSSKGHLTEHLRSHASLRPFKCTKCEKCFISSRHLKIHDRVHSNDKPYSCIVCNKSFRQSSSLKLHMKLHPKEPELLTCALCKNSFKIKEELEVHICLQELIKKESKYYEVGKSEDRKGADNKISEIRQNFCSPCNRKVRSLKVHNKQHHKDDLSGSQDTSSDYKLCTVCGKQFKNGSKLSVHMRIHTGESPYKCSYCDKRLTARNHLVVHERTHTGERPHVCTYCKKAFSQSSVLNTHMKLHTGRPEVCSVCSQRFCRPAELRLHMRKHTGEKPYNCTQCGQAFIQRSHLMEHLKTHSDDRPYQCPYCERAFKQSSSLKSHAQIHLGHKPYRCSQCSYACRQSYSLTQHMKQHSNDAPRPEKPHICVICQKGYTTLAMLTSHAASAHGVTNF